MAISLTGDSQGLHAGDISACAVVCFGMQLPVHQNARKVTDRHMPGTYDLNSGGAESMDGTLSEGKSTEVFRLTPGTSPKEQETCGQAAGR